MLTMRAHKLPFTQSSFHTGMTVSPAHSATFSFSAFQLLSCQYVSYVGNPTALLLNRNVPHVFSFLRSRDALGSQVPVLRNSEEKISRT